MTALTTKKRHELDDDQFALPGRRYPIPDAAHAKNAKARASEMFNRGMLSKEELEIVNHKADKVIEASA